MSVYGLYWVGSNPLENLPTNSNSPYAGGCLTLEYFFGIIISLQAKLNTKAKYKNKKKLGV
jgi:hypothetical protein